MRVSASLVSVVFALALACGGGGGGDKNDCAALATKVNACIVQGGDEADPDMQAICEATTCTGDKQAVIDCVMALECTADMGSQSQECARAQGCLQPPSCEDVSTIVVACLGLGEDDVDDVIAGCEATTCTGSKVKALQCVAAIPLSTCSQAAIDACNAAEGCAVSDDGGSGDPKKSAR